MSSQKITAAINNSDMDESDGIEKVNLRVFKNIFGNTFYSINKVSSRLPAPRLSYMEGLHVQIIELDFNQYSASELSNADRRKRGIEMP